MEKSFFIRIIGCQMNVYDGDKLRGELLSRGWREADGEDGADFVVFLTCSVRERAEQKAASEIGKFGKKWKKSRSPRLALLGCMAARIGSGLARKFPWIAVTAGPAHIGLVPDAMDRALETGERFIADRETQAADPISCAPRGRGNPHKAYITVANGCDQFCAYCIVPYVRGRFASRAPEDVLAEARALARNGVVEITLLGQNVDAYGRDFDGDARGRFASLLNDVSAIGGLRRVRFATSHPSDFTDDILDVMRDRPNICPSINLPVQAGSNSVLRGMNRRYTRDEYVSLVRRIRAALPESAVTTDLIVGFPGETEEEFEQSVTLFEELRFDLAHTAAYSPRDGTPAANRPDQVPPVERARRLVRLNGVQAEISREINASMVGRIYEVLLDEPAPRGEGLLQGRTATDKVVLVRAPLEMAGTFREARVTGSSPWCLEGELV
ncbi:MAG: tRNA (N6-isopentenyl adenosine(37)-C2)-methylthiotransferase MiaB [Synergistaceae bacterium]|nr:tRNA (N6-isopentenyl adenosine(37)-C2)-methylthiotransferase MiaB [Synergistaceae bacterium]